MTRVQAITPQGKRVILSMDAEAEQDSEGGYRVWRISASVDGVELCRTSALSDAAAWQTLRNWHFYYTNKAEEVNA